jgi:hypothetical protein
LDQSLLEILACPACKTKVELVADRLVCVHCGRRYRIEDSIPIMLLDEAEPPSPDWQPEGE